MEKKKSTIHTGKTKPKDKEIEVFLELNTLSEKSGKCKELCADPKSGENHGVVYIPGSIVDGEFTEDGDDT